MARRAWVVEISLVAALFAGGLALRLSFGRGYVYAGTDSYGYVKLAEEWRAHGRYALGPGPEPLYFGRPPLYPAFVALVKGDAPALASGGDGWRRIVVAQGLIDVLVTGVLVWWMARRLAGPVAAAVALGFDMFVPFTVITVGAALTECLAMALTTAAVAPLILWRERPRRALALSGALAALAALVRPDGILVAFALAPAVLRLPSWRERALGSLIAATAFALVFAPWPVRNLHRFGQAWPFGTRVDFEQRPVAHWEGPQHFMQSYGRDWQTFNDGRDCMFELGCSWNMLEQGGAIDTPEERDALRVLLQRQQREGLTGEVGRGYEELARAKMRRHPIRTTILLPARRAFQMWTDAHDEIFQKPPLPRVYGAIRPALPLLMALLALALEVGAFGMLGYRPLRWDGAVLLAAVLGRTAVLAYTFFCMTRYIREVMPLGYVMMAVGAVAWARMLRTRRRTT